MEDPRYTVFVEVLKEPTREKFVKTLLDRSILDFKSLYTNFLKISETNARHHLKQLLNDEIIIKEKQKGSKAMFLRLNPPYLERARKHFKLERKYMYIGMAGINNPGMQIKESIRRLRTEGWNFETVTIFTTDKVINLLGKDKNWLPLKEDFPDSKLVSVPLIAFDKTYQIMKSIIDEQIQLTSIIVDVTGLTKIHTLALYILAKEYGLQRIYLPEKKKDEVISLP